MQLNTHEVGLLNEVLVQKLKILTFDFQKFLWYLLTRNFGSPKT